MAVLRTEQRIAKKKKMGISLSVASPVSQQLHLLVSCAHSQGSARADVYVRLSSV